MMVPWEKIQDQLHQAEEGTMRVSGKRRKTKVYLTSASNETGWDERRDTDVKLSLKA